jgi:CDP-6-deoxy-D-xylo-4-hexulose-3-dehydrase
MKTYPLASSTWGDEEIQAIQKVIDSDRFTMGHHVKQFEFEFSEYFGSRNAVMVNSGSTANLLMLSLLRWKKRLPSTANIIVPAVGWSTTYFPIVQNNFGMNFVDVDPYTFNINVEQVREAIDENTVAIMPVNLCGNPCDYNELLMICDEHNLFLLEDNCESMGGRWAEHYLGTIGDMGSHSFFFSHHMCTMEGGMILTDDDEDADFLRSLRAHGWCRDLSENSTLYQRTGDFFTDSFTFIAPGYSVRPLEMSGAIGSEQLKKWDSIIEGRLENTAFFQSLFSDVPWLNIQQEHHGESSWFSFGCVLDGTLKGRRNEVVKAFDQNGIEARPLASGNFLKQPVMEYFDNTLVKFPLSVAENIDTNGFWVGNHMVECKKGIKKMYDILKGLAE